MNITPEIRASHEALSPHGLAYLEYMEAHPEWHKPVDELIGTPAGQAGQRSLHLMSWPPVMSQASYDDSQRILADILRLNQSIPERLFDSDPHKLMQVYPMDEEAARGIVRKPYGLTGAITRSDLVWAPDDWKLVEVNSSPMVAGVDMCYVVMGLLGHPMMTTFLEQQGLQGMTPNTEALYFEHMIRETLRFTEDIEDECNIGIWFEGVPEEPDPQPEAVNEDFRKRIGTIREGLTGNYFVFRDLEKVEQRGDDLYFMGHRLHLIFRLPVYDSPAHVLEAFKKRRFRWFGCPMDMLQSDKRNLALLSENGDNPDLFDAAERETIRRHIPWSRRLQAGPSTYRGQKVESLLDLVIERKDEFLIKPCIGHAGRDVFAGAALEADEWRKMIEEGAEGDLLVQEMVESRPYLWQYKDEGIIECRAVWGIFRFGDTAGGSVMRIKPMSLPPGVINSLHGGMASAAAIAG